jgi:hypothetical protein
MDGVVGLMNIEDYCQLSKDLPMAIPKAQYFSKGLCNKLHKEILTVSNQLE